MNRNYHARPRQAGSRTQADYGRTTLVKPPVPSGGWVWFIIIAAAVAMGALWLAGYAGDVV